MNTPIDFVKYSGAGNDFILVDDRNLNHPDAVYSEICPKFCDRHFGVGSDGLMVIRPSEKYDFTMLYFNPDGSRAGMCGNGGRCISAYFSRLTGKTEIRFETLSGVYFAVIQQDGVALTMIDPFDFTDPGLDSSLYLNTGTQHLVVFKPSVDLVPVDQEGRKLRFSAFADSKKGVNVNFVEITGPDSIKIRTYEKGVEAETLACGTGTVAGAIAAFRAGLISSQPVQVTVRSGKVLTVGFSPEFKNVVLSGSAEFIYSGTMSFQIHL